MDGILSQGGVGILLLALIIREGLSWLSYVRDKQLDKKNGGSRITCNFIPPGRPCNIEVSLAERLRYSTEKQVSMKDFDFTMSKLTEIAENLRDFSRSTLEVLNTQSRLMEKLELILEVYLKKGEVK